MVAAVEFLVELERRETELLEAVLPEAHVLEVAERLVVRLDPVWAGNEQNTREGEVNDASLMLVSEECGPANVASKLLFDSKTGDPHLVKAITRSTPATYVRTPPKTMASVNESEGNFGG